MRSTERRTQTTSHFFNTVPHAGLAILFQAVLGLIGIGVMKKVLPTADANLRWPPGRTLAGLGFVIGIGMALVMLVADYCPQLLMGEPFGTPYPTNPVDATGWLVSMAITGLAEEAIFRGLLVGGLALFVTGRVRAGRFDVSLAGVVVALLFCAAHWQTFVVDPLHMAVAQQSYAFAWGLVYVWGMERSRSLLAPIIAHESRGAHLRTSEESHGLTIESRPQPCCKLSSAAQRSTALSSSAWRAASSSSTGWTSGNGRA